MKNSEEQGLFDRLTRHESMFSKGQKRIAQYVKEHYELVASETAARVGQACQVSESTVVRFAILLGYDGYPEFQSALLEELKQSLSIPQRMNVFAKLGAEEKSDFLAYVYDHDIQMLRKARKDRDPQAFHACVDALLSAKRIFIVGVRSSAPLAQFLAYYLSLFLPDVRAILPGASSEMVERLLPMDMDDVLLGISFPRYSARTVRAMAFAQSRGAAVVGITDQNNSPLAAYCDTLLTVPCDMLALADSLTPAFSLITALIAGAAERVPDKVAASLNFLESASESFNQRVQEPERSQWEAEYES